MAQKLVIPNDVIDDLKKFKSVGMEGETVTVDASSIVDVCKYLKDEKGFDHLASLSGVDMIQNKSMSVVYHLWSTEKNQLVVLKVVVARDAGAHVCHEGGECDGAPEVPSIASVYDTAEWQEREAFDLLGINFKGHPDLKRVVLKDDWIGHPLRKDDTSGVPPYQIDWKLAMLRQDEKAVFNMKSIQGKLDKIAEVKGK